MFLICARSLACARTSTISFEQAGVDICCWRFWKSQFGFSGADFAFVQRDSIQENIEIDTKRFHNKCVGFVFH